MSRCYACCQENCGYHRCSCDCHEEKKPVSTIPDNKWTIADRYFYQAGPLPEDRYDAETQVASTLKGYLHSPCKKHPKYKALRRPRTACEVCWRFYIKTNP